MYVADHWQTWSHNVVSRTHRIERGSNSTLVVIGSDSCKFNYHSITTTTSISYKGVLSTQVPSNAWARWVVSWGGHEHRGPVPICVCCVRHVFFLMFIHWLCWKYCTNTILDICLILSTIYIFIHVSGCVGRGPSALLCPGAYYAAKTALEYTQPRKGNWMDKITYNRDNLYL